MPTGWPTQKDLPDLYQGEIFFTLYFHNTFIIHLIISACSLYLLFNLSSYVSPSQV